jgi:hypothetical protein
MRHDLAQLFVLSSCLLLAPIPALAEAPDTPAGVTVELLDAGATPRSELRFAPKAGDKQIALMTMKMNQAMTISGNKLPSQAIPPQTVTMEIAVTEVTPEGDIHFAFKYVNIDVVDDPSNPSPLSATIRTTLKPLIGSTGSGIVTNRGITKKGEFNIPEDLAPQIKSMLTGMKDAMNQLSAPVPAEPVGIGATWRVVSDLNANGMRLKQTTVHKLTKLDADGFTTSVEVMQHADPQDIQNPALPPGTVVKLTSLESKGDGSSTILNGQVMPRQSTVKIGTKIGMDISAAGQNQSMTIDQTMEMELAPQE